MKTKWKILGVLGVLVVAVALYIQADLRDWDLKSRVPTSRIEDSKAYGVFAGSLDIVPREVDLGDSHYQVAEAWLEHRTEPERLSLFFTRQTIHTDLILCVRIKSKEKSLAELTSNIRIKGANIEHTHFFASNDVLYSEVGILVPKFFVLRSEITGKEETLRLMMKGPKNASETASMAATLEPQR